MSERATIRTSTPELRAVMWRRGRRWFGRIDDRSGRTVEAGSRAACVELLRKAAARSVLTIEVAPELVGVAEAAELLGWDKRRVFTYISRGAFPEPLALLASGRVWRKRDIEEYARVRRRRT